MEVVAQLAKGSLDRTLTAVVFLFVVVAIEMLSPRQEYPLRARLKGASFYVIGGVASVIIFAGLGWLWDRSGARPMFTLKFDEWFGWAGWFAIPLATAAAVLVGDFFGYWYHRAQHVITWPFHAVHHSIEDLHAGNSYVHIAEEVFRFAFVVIPMSLLPIHGPVVPAVIGVYLNASQFFIHSPTRLNFGPLLRRVFTDNVYHRIHHSTDPRHFNKNFGTTLTIWDQVFGTAYFPRPGEWPEKTGLAEVREPRTFREWVDLPFRFMRAQRLERSQAASWSER